MKKVLPLILLINAAAFASTNVSVSLQTTTDTSVQATWFRGGGDWDCGGNRPSSEDKSMGGVPVYGYINESSVFYDTKIRDEASETYFKYFEELDANLKKCSVDLE